METKTPKILGYHIPAEWEHHEGTWLQWPQDKLYHGYEPGVCPDGERGISFWGQSFVADPDRSILKQASRDQEEIVICPVDLSQIEEPKKIYFFPYRDRRVDSYQDLLKLYLE